MNFKKFSKTMVIAAILLAIISTSAIAEGNRFVEFAFKVPVEFQNFTNNNNKYVLFQGNMGGDVAFTNMFNRIIGVTADFGFYFPFAMALTKTQPDGTSTTTSFIQNDFTDSWNIDLLLGPTFAPVYNSKVAVLLTPGFTFQVCGAKGNTIEKGNTYLNIGLGINAVCDIMLSNIFYIKTMLGFDWYFNQTAFATNNRTTTVTNARVNNFCLTPGVGFGFRL